MTDKELLELAAKAAGITKAWDQGPTVPDDNNRVRYWKPLTDDGDALRLAVKLSIDIECLRAIGYDKTTAVHCQTLAGYMVNVGIDEGCNGDPYEATRRAIVRAAAEIGKAL